MYVYHNFGLKKKSFRGGTWHPKKRHASFIAKSCGACSVDSSDNQPDVTLNDAKHKLCDTQPFESTTRQKAICYNEDKMAQKFNIVPTAKHKRTLTTAKRCVYRDLRCLNLISSQIIFVRLSNRQKGSLEVSLATGEMRLISPGQNAQV